MNESNKLGILKWRSWSAAWKGMVIGAALAAFMTIFIDSILLMTQHASQNSPLTGLLYLLLVPDILIAMPAWFICYLCDWRYPEYLTAGWICFIVTINTMVYGMLGYLVGWGIQRLVKLVRVIRKK